MDSRMCNLDLCINLVILQYGEQKELEELHELLMLEYEEEKFTIDELTQWASMLWEVEELERSFDYHYQESTQYEEN